MADDDKELKDQRVVTMMTPSELEAIDDWMFKNRIRSRGEAIRRLCQMGLVLDENMPPILEYSRRATLSLFDMSRQASMVLNGERAAGTAFFKDMLAYRPVVMGNSLHLYERLQRLFAAVGEMKQSDVDKGELELKGLRADLEELDRIFEKDAAESASFLNADSLKKEGVEPVAPSPKIRQIDLGPDPDKSDE